MSNMNPNNLVCRTCLGIISEGKVAHNIDDENGLIRNVRNIREMIMFCVPEMDIYISVSPVICETCLGTLVSVYNYKIRCLRVENAIRSYIVANNVMEGSCVNLNNVVRQQIVEALKQKNWPPEIIREYLDKHLCAAKNTANMVPTEVIQTMSKKFNTHKILNNTVSNSPLPIETPPRIDSLFRTPVSNAPPPSSEANCEVNTGPRYLSVSKNLMPPRPEPASFSQQLIDVNQINSSPRKAPTAHNMLPLPVNSMPNIGEFQTAFLHSLQLVSTANGGREEAVLLKKKERPKRTGIKTKIKKTPFGTQILIPVKPGVPLPNSDSNSGSPNPIDTGKGLSNSENRALCPITGMMKLIEAEGSKQTGLRNVRRSKDSNESEKEDVIILDDDDIENAGKNVNEFGDKQNTTQTSVLAKKMVVKLPMLNKETLKRKLSPEDVIEEILAKRRKLIVNLNSSLPYLHKNKQLIVKLQKDRIFKCVFCMYATFDEKILRSHYLDNHKVCSRCNFKCDRSIILTQHINIMHPLDLKEALKRCEDNKTEFLCYLCNFAGLSEYDLRDHRLRIHIKCDSRGMYKCPYLTCKKELAIAYDIVKHIEKNHDRLWQTQCPLCNYTNPFPYIVKKHIVTHSLTKMKCSKCSFFCKTAFSLNLHMKKKHPETEDQNETGMVFAEMDDENDERYSDDYRITLDTLQPRPPESRKKTSASNTRSGRTLDEYEFAMPSLSEMLCTQTFSEDPPDQEGDCAIVTDDLPESRNNSPAKINKTRKKKFKESSPVDDPEDCMIINQEIPTVDLSDDDESLPDVIEIDDHNDNDDCFVISDITAAENSTQTNFDAVEGTNNLPPPDESETDTASEVSAGAKKQSPQGVISGSETETCSELSVSEIISQSIGEKNTDVAIQKAKDDVNSDKAGESELEASQKDASRNMESHQPGHSQNLTSSIVDDTCAQNNLQLNSSEDQNEGDLSKKGTTSDKISPSVSQQVSSPEQPNTNTSEKPEDESTSCINDSKESSEKVKAPVEINKDLEELLNERFPDVTKDSKVENTPESQLNATIPDICSESFLIESSDEESNDCTIVSQSGTQENMDKDGSKAPDVGDKDDISEKSQRLEEELVVKETNDVAATDDLISEKSDKKQTADEHSLGSIEEPQKNVIEDDLFSIPSEQGEDSKVSREKITEKSNCDNESVQKKVDDCKDVVPSSKPIHDSGVIDTDSEMNDISSHEISIVEIFDGDKSVDKVEGNTTLNFAESELKNDVTIESEADLDTFEGTTSKEKEDTECNENTLETSSSAPAASGVTSETEVPDSEMTHIVTDDRQKASYSGLDISNTDSKMEESENIESSQKTSDKDASDHLDTNIEMENVETSENSKKVYDKHKTDSDVLNNDSKMESENIENADSGIPDSEMKDIEFSEGSLEVEKKSSTPKVDLEKNKSPISSHEISNVETFDDESVDKVEGSNTGTLAESELKNDLTDQKMSSQESLDKVVNIESEANLDTVESSTSKEKEGSECNENTLKN